MRCGSHVHLSGCAAVQPLLQASLPVMTRCENMTLSIQPLFQASLPVMTRCENMTLSIQPLLQASLPVMTRCENMTLSIQPLLQASLPVMTRCENIPQSCFWSLWIHAPELSLSFAFSLFTLWVERHLKNWQFCWSEPYFALTSWQALSITFNRMSSFKLSHGQFVKGPQWYRYMEIV